MALVEKKKMDSQGVGCETKTPVHGGGSFPTQLELFVDNVNPKKIRFWTISLGAYSTHFVPKTRFLEKNVMFLAF